MRLSFLLPGQGGGAGVGGGGSQFENETERPAKLNQWQKNRSDKKETAENLTNPIVLPRRPKHKKTHVKSAYEEDNKKQTAASKQNYGRRAAKRGNKNGGRINERRGRPYANREASVKERTKERKNERRRN